MPKRRQHGEGSVFQRSRDGRWVARVELGRRNGKRDSRLFTGATPAEAITRRQEWLDARRDGIALPKGRAMTVDAWMLHWLDKIAKREVRASTWNTSYRSYVTRRIAPYFEGIPLPDLDEDMIDAFHADLEEDGLSAATITQIHRIMSRALKVAVVRKRIGRNPASNVSAPQIKGRRRPPVLSAAETAQLIEACFAWPRGLRWLVGMNTGMRQGEVLGLTWDHVDLDEGLIQVMQELVRLPWQHGCEDARSCGSGGDVHPVTGKARPDRHRYPCPVPCPKVRPSGRRHACVKSGDKRCCPPDCTRHASTCPRRRGGGLVLTEPKSEKSVRPVPVGKELATMLREHRRAQLAARLAAPDWTGWKPGELVFAGPRGRPVDGRRDWQDWSDLLVSIGIPHRRVHDLRHGVGTDLLEAAVDVRVVQELLGHSTPHFTRATYQDVRPVLARQAADVLDARLRRP